MGCWFSYTKREEKRYLRHLEQAGKEEEDDLVEDPRIAQWALPDPVKTVSKKSTW